MKYYGSNWRYARPIADTIQPFLKPDDIFVQLAPSRAWVSSFVQCNEKYMYFLDEGICQLLQKIDSGWVPPLQIGSVMYYWMRDHQADLQPYMSCFIGRSMSRAGKFWDQYTLYPKVNPAIYAFNSLKRTIRTFNETSEHYKFDMLFDAWGFPKKFVCYTDLTQWVNQGWTKEQAYGQITLKAEGQTLFISDDEDPPFTFHRKWEFPQDGLRISNLYMVESF